MFTDESRQTYKSTYEIFKEIAKIWNELSDKNQAELLEKLAGKRNSQVVAAAIKNFATAEKAMNEMANSQGNAMAEMEIVYESINYKVNQFKETLVGIAQGLFSQDFLKSMVDSGTRILNVFDDLTPSLSFILEQFATLLEFVTKLADTIGGIPTLMLGIGIKNIGSPKMFGLVLNLPIIRSVLCYTKVFILSFVKYTNVNEVSICWETGKPYTTLI